MKSTLFGLILASMFPLSALASIVAVVDSGTDFNHEKLKGHQFINAKEIAGNRIDDDNNGKVDDVSGWNFADKYGTVFFPQHEREIQPIAYKLIEVVAHTQAGKATDDEKKFWQENVTSLSAEDKQALVTHLNYFGQYAHSTHVSGIVTTLAPDAKILSLRIFADAPPEDFKQRTPLAATQTPGSSPAGGGFTGFLYRMFATVGAQMFEQVSEYQTEMHADVANYSLALSLGEIAKKILALRGKATPTTAELAAETTAIYSQFEPKAVAYMAKNSETLYVRAAGNDGADNDVIPVFPANVKAVNALTVAASQDYQKIASFSNYGKTTVDIAAPGVAIVSSVPSPEENKMLPMSGTSMASPYVAGVAAHMKDVNPQLTAPQMREILMGTVDVKEWLKDKVISSGIVNPERAYAASEKAASMSIQAAIEDARKSVADKPETFQPMGVRPTWMPQDLHSVSSQLVF